MSQELTSRRLTTTVGLIVGLGFHAGLIYWFWMAYEVGSWWMVLFGLVPPTIGVAVLTGAWSLFFGIPDWVWRLFG